MTSSSIARQPGAAAPRSTAPISGEPRDGTHDFDFLEGRWRVHHRRLRRPLSGSSDWYEFEGSAVERTLWDGRANLEEVEVVMPTGRLRALALRLYDPASRQWSIHWSNSAAGTLDTPMIGEFRDGRGVFLCQERYDGRVILQRFIWTSGGPDACRWEQAYSADCGASWETNWIMEFTRDG
jgi:hypothetical protein